MSKVPEARQPRHVLLVEDEPGLQEVMAAVLMAEGYAVTVARDGEQGLVRLAESRPDLVITDYMMPQMDGIEMIRRIRADPAYADMPILLVSAALIRDVRPLADGFLRKPISIDQLQATIAQLLAPRSSPA
jgi:two-component system phosphate regulon response regulator PhoB